MPYDRSVLNTAQQKFLDGDESLSLSYYERAVREGVPSEIVTLHKITKGYLVFPLDFPMCDEYFKALSKVKGLAERSDEYKDEYISALKSLADIKTLFLREVALYYFSELVVCYPDSLIVKNIHVLFEYLDRNLEALVECYRDDINAYLKTADADQLKRELLKVKAYCLNLLLSYTAAQGSAYSGTTYTAYTYDYGYYSSTHIAKHDNYTTWAVLKPRLHLVGLGAYYDRYLQYYNDTVSSVRKYGEFNSAKELKNEITQLVEQKRKKEPSDQAYYKYAKRFEKEDPSRFSLIKLGFNLNPFMRLFARPYKKLYSIDQVGSFELDTVFTRKKLFGVCDMLSCGLHMNIATVRAIMIVAGCLGVGVLIYLALAIAMKLNFYLPSIMVEKH